MFLCRFLFIFLSFLSFSLFSEAISQSLDTSMKEVFQNINTRQKTIEFIKNYRWGDGYTFWIIDSNSIMLVHNNKEIEGTKILNFKDVTGRKIFREIIDNPNGYFHHVWFFNEKGLHPATTLVKFYKPFGWIIGTTIRIETIENFVLPFQKEVFKDNTKPASPM